MTAPDAVDAGAGTRRCRRLAVPRRGPMTAGPSGSRPALLSPAEPGFWAAFTASPEYARRRARPAGPLVETGDRRACRRPGAARRCFPPTGRPTRRSSPGRWPRGGPGPRRSGCWCMTAGPLAVVSRRRAAAGDAVAPAPGTTPCDDLRGPALPDRLPASGADAGGYDIAACHAYLDTAEGRRLPAAAAAPPGALARSAPGIW